MSTTTLTPREQLLTRIRAPARGRFEDPHTREDNTYASCRNGVRQSDNSLRTVRQLTQASSENYFCLNAFELRADLEATPVLDGQVYYGKLKDVFNEIADYGNFIWELRRPSEDEWVVEWTQPGQRQADSSADIADYRVTKDWSERAERAVIKGGAQPVDGEQFDAQYNTWADLDQTDLVPGKADVRDPDTGDHFEHRVDYELDQQAGRIRVLSTGSMIDGNDYEISYEYKPVGSYTAANAGKNPDEIVRTVSSLTTDRACEQAALYLIQRIQDPQWEAEVTLPKLDADLSLVDDLALEGLPTRGVRTEVQNIEQSPEQVVLHLGTWRSPGDVLDDFKTQINSVSALA